MRSVPDLRLDAYQMQELYHRQRLTVQHIKAATTPTPMPMAIEATPVKASLMSSPSPRTPSIVVLAPTESTKSTKPTIKCCSVCHVVRHRTGFRLDEQSSDGLSSACIICLLYPEQAKRTKRSIRLAKAQAIVEMQQRVEKEEEEMLNSDQMIAVQRKRRDAVKIGYRLIKSCYACNELKPVAEFATCNLNEDGLSQVCIVCEHMHEAQKAVDQRVLQDQPIVRQVPTPVLGGFISKDSETADARASRKYQFLIKYKRRWAKASQLSIDFVKTCQCCLKTKPIGAFEVDAYEDDALSAECMACVAEHELIAREQAAAEAGASTQAEKPMEGDQGVSNV